MQINYLKKLWTFTYFHQQNLSPFNMEINNFSISVWDHKKKPKQKQMYHGCVKEREQVGFAPPPLPPIDWVY